MITKFLMVGNRLTQLISVATLLLLVHKSASQPKPLAHPSLCPFCISQFAVANPLSSSSNQSHHNHHHGHSRKQSHQHCSVHETEAQEECCRWLKALDNSCVCDLLDLLPVFLSKPTHGYTVAVDDECKVKFE